MSNSSPYGPGEGSERDPSLSQGEEKRGGEEEMRKEEGKKIQSVKEGDGGGREGENQAPRAEESREASGGGRRRYLDDDDAPQDHDDGGSAAADNDGYLTPTSPQHSIPSDPPCPLAPRKRKLRPRRRWQKLKVGDQELHRIVRRRLHLPDEVELLLFPVVNDQIA
ncbi:unnamed protein product [Spirodela intermedia]|uniref:Uncharacterized protein n=1 Tax=Spirodela intermedia TaxID=51605 RepID=A0A7I8IVF0_SPIIN|nr:unnamed protein product [Spirodela intermedia]CAA6661749.1 unnamed protein product [Spirodela intermedia]